MIVMNGVPVLWNWVICIGVGSKINQEKSDTTVCQKHEEHLLQVCEYLNTFIFLGLSGRGIDK